MSKTLLGNFDLKANLGGTEQICKDQDQIKQFPIFPQSGFLNVTQQIEDPFNSIQIDNQIIQDSRPN